jgi:hypothetical protein
VKFKKQDNTPGAVPYWTKDDIKFVRYNPAKHGEVHPREWLLNAYNKQAPRYADEAQPMEQAPAFSLADEEEI